MSNEIKLWCWVQGDEVYRVFDIQIKPSDTISTLKRLIRDEKPSFQHIAADILEPRKFGLSLESMDDDSARLIRLEDGQPLQGWKDISDYWTEQPAKGILSVILPRPAGTTITPSSSNTSNLSAVPPSWLVEIHQKLWGRRDLFDQIFRTANLTKTDFIELQAQLHHRNSSRTYKSYVATNVLALKSDFLRYRSVDTAANFSKYDAASNGQLVPKLDVDKSNDLVPITARADVDSVDTDAIGADAVDIQPLDIGAEPDHTDDVHTDAMDADFGVEPNPNSPSYYDTNAAFLSDGSAAVLPCTIRYMDLTVLKLKHLTRVPHVMLIRDDWEAVVDIFNRRQKGILGSAAITGQPGIGKTCLLFYILIFCIIRAQPIVFQDKGGGVSLISDEVLQKEGSVVVPGDDVLALVDADGKSCTPKQFLLDTANLRVLLISSPRSRDDRKWLTQDVRETQAVFVAKPWSREEFLITSMFLAGVDITLKRFRDITNICGHIPRPCFAAALSPDALLSATREILDAIDETKNLADTIAKVHNGRPIHRAFEIFPSPESRRWINCLIRPVSDWAFSQMLAELDRQGADTAYHFYRAIQGSRDSAELVGRMFETKVHVFFQSITTPRSFTAFSLDDRSTTFDIEFSSSTTHYRFGAKQYFTGELASSVNNRKSCYLKPLSRHFATFDSFLYQPEILLSGCQSLIGFQVTTAYKHRISVLGLKELQACLNPKIPALKALRPTPAEKLILLFVVPEPMAASFQKMPFEGKAAHWGAKITQFVLELPEPEVIRSYQVV